MLNLTQLKVLAVVARHGSVTAAARELHYSQPSVSHHLSRLEAATGTKLVQRVGRGIRLTPEGRMLANRATEILGRVDAATSELAAQVGLQSGRVRLAANASTMSTIVAEAAGRLAEAHPGLELSPIERHPAEGVQMLRHGEVDIALTFRHPGDEAEEGGVRLTYLGRDPLYLLSTSPHDDLAVHRDSTWIGGCARCTEELVGVCGSAGFTPHIKAFSDEIVVVQSLVAAGVGVAIMPGLSLRAHRRPGIHAAEIAGFPRDLYAATYGEPPDPPAVAAVLTTLTETADTVTGGRR